jgi:hypothetical protein
MLTLEGRPPNPDAVTFSIFRSGCVGLGSGLRHRAARRSDNCNSSSEDHLDQNRLTFRLLPTLVASIGFLVLLSVGSVLIVIWIGDRRIVQDFTSRLIMRVLSAKERSLRDTLTLQSVRAISSRQPSEPDAFSLASLRWQTLLVVLWRH